MPYNISRHSRVAWEGSGLGDSLTPPPGVRLVFWDEEGTKSATRPQTKLVYFIYRTSDSGQPEGGSAGEVGGAWW